MAIFVQLKVIPNASKNQVVSFEYGVLRVRIKGVPENGKVNEELIAFLAKELGIAKSNIELTRGQASRFKRLKIEGMTQEQLNAKFS